MAYGTVNVPGISKAELDNIVETGEGILTYVSAPSVSIRYANYTYQRVGNFVTLNIKIQINASTGNLLFSGLPFSTQKISHGSCVSDENVICRWNISNDRLEIKKSDGSGVWAHNSGESVNFVATYEI
ncbi:MAG: hypothetical protein J1E56_07390 [Ruminococcus sp.]|nr:hypothetical protein [Ruminococcus sp.]